MQSSASYLALPVPLSTVLATAQLHQRLPREPDFESESRMLGTLAQMLATAPQSVLQTLADAALQLCGAHSAGISLLEDDGGEQVFRWQVLVGQLTNHLGNSLPRTLSLYGAVLDCDAVQLISRPGRLFPYIDAMRPTIEEALLIPFHVNGVTLGMLCVMTHDQTRRFDAEDARLMTSLGRFAAAACEVLGTLKQIKADVAERHSIADLVAAHRNKDRFIAILAHELRGPLSTVKNAAELLKSPSLDAVAIRRIYEVIDRQVGGMNRLIEDLLDVSRLRLGNFELRRTEITVAQVVERAVEIARPLVLSRGHVLVVRIPPEPILISADEMRLSQVLQNLIANAAKYTNSGGQIRLAVQREDNDVLITVKDNGMGIVPSQLDAIFELYAQGGQAVKERSSGGLGIGLYLARRLVEAHGGSVKIVSEGLDMGSECIVRLPCKPVTRSLSVEQ